MRTRPNTQPHGGLIFIGVEDKGAINGCKSLSTGSLNQLEAVRDYCPDARYEHKKVAIRNRKDEDDFILIIRVKYREDKLVETTQGEAFIRVGESKRRISEDEKREIRISKGEVSYELEPANLNWPDDFDMELVSQLASSYRAKRRLTSDFTREAILNLLHLGKLRNGQFEPNLACALVLAKSPRDIVPGARLRFSRFTGRDERFGKDLNKTLDEFIDGPIPRQLTTADKMISTVMQNFTRLGRDNKFYTRPEYPHDVWFEAVVNACVHRSYNLKNMPTFIKMFDDRFIVESPGGFLYPTTPATVYDAHNPRNPYTMEALFYLDFVHCGYEGTRRMRAGMKEADLPLPEFRQSGDGSAAHVVRVTLKNNFEHRKVYLVQDAARAVGETLYDALSEVEKQLINFASEKGEMSVSDAVRLTGKDWSTAKKILQKLTTETKILVHRASSTDPRNGTKRYLIRKVIKK